MIVNSNGERVSAKIKAKLVLTDYVKAFDLKSATNNEKLTDKELERIQEQVTKIVERMNKALVIK
jgi:hypothetical protein